MSLCSFICWTLWFPCIKNSRKWGFLCIEKLWKKARLITTISFFWVFSLQFILTHTFLNHISIVYQFNFILILVQFSSCQCRGYVWSSGIYDMTILKHYYGCDSVIQGNLIILTRFRGSHYDIFNEMKICTWIAEVK